MSEFLIVSLVLLWISVGLLFVVQIALARRLNEEIAYDVEALDNGEAAPPFSADTVTGAPFSLPKLLQGGMKSLLVFISPNCEPCRAQLGTILRLAEAVPTSGIVLILVSLGEPSATKDLANEFDIRIPLLIAPRGSNSLADDYKVRITPFYYVIDEGGKVEANGVLNQEWQEKVSKWFAAAEMKVSDSLPVTAT